MILLPLRRYAACVAASLSLSVLLTARAALAQTPASTGVADTAVTDKNAGDKNAGDKKTAFGHSMLGDAFNEIPRQRAYLMKGMPHIDFPITTRSREAQRFFNQGIGQMHGFWFLEAARTFRKVVELDPACAMGYWGLAMANLDDDAKVKDFIAKAVEHKSAATERERLWIDSVTAYANADPKMKDRDTARKAALSKALWDIIAKYPLDIEAKAFAAYVWIEIYRDPKHSQDEMNTLMNQVLAVNPMHPIHHYRIHLWDSTATEKNALNSAALNGSTSPGIAHMWHMQGHTYTGLRRYADAAYSQEASARVDHAYMMRDHVLPDEIHNYAHNNQWLIENLEYLGRVHDAVTLGMNMIELPRHPRFNAFNTNSYGSAVSGRSRLIETLFCYDLWEDALRLDREGYIDPGVSPNQQITRLTLLGDAGFASGDTSVGRQYLQELLAMQEAHNPVTEIKKEDKKESGKKEVGNPEDTKKEVVNKEHKKFEKKEVVNTAIFDPKGLEQAIAEVRTYEALAAGSLTEAAKQLDLASKIPMTRAARLRLQVGQKDKAEQIAREAVKQSANHVAPLATLVDILVQNGKQEEAVKQFGELRKLAGNADQDTPLLAKLSGLAQQAGCTSPDWRTPTPSPSDIGPRPSLDTLGPFRWSPTPASNFTLRSATGAWTSLTDYTKQGKPVVVIFYLGTACSKCREQLTAFAQVKAEYDKAGITLIAISTEPLDFLKKQVRTFDLQAKYPFPLLSDKENKVFKSYRVYDDFEGMPLHGTFLIDGNGLVRWQDIRFEPFMDANFVLNEAKRLLAQKVPPAPPAAQSSIARQ